MSARAFTVPRMHKRYPWFPVKTAAGLERVGFKPLARGVWQKNLHNGRYAVATHIEGEPHWDLKVRTA